MFPLFLFLHVFIVSVMSWFGIGHGTKSGIKSSDDKMEIIKTLVVQTSRWSVAASQDKNPFIANLHANYGVGYVSALRDIASDAEILAATGVDVIRLQQEVVGIQREAALRLFKECPNVVPMDNMFLTQISQRI